MANLRDLIVNGVTKHIGKAYAQTPPQGTVDTQIATTEFVSKFPFKGYTPPLLSMQQSTIKLNDIQWLRSDTFSWQDGTLYEATYNKLVEEYNSTDKTVLINASTTGTPTVTDQGVVSGFSASNYLSKAITLSADRAAVFPIVFNVTTGSDVVTEQYIASIATWCMQLSIGTDSKLKLYLGSGSAWDIANGVSGSTVLKANNNYEVEIDYDGTTYTVKLTDLTSTTLTVTTDIEVASSTMVCTGSRTLLIGTNAGHTIPFLGSIDVSKCQVDEAWKGTFGYRTQNDFFIVGPEQEFYCLQKYNLDGIAWYFILDTANTRFKLPRTKWAFKGLRDQAGNEISESLPNISGTFNADASLYNSIYQEGAHVQEKGTQAYTYFYVGEWTKKATENTAGIKTELFNSKLDINGSNLSAQGRSYFSEFSMPSAKFENQTVGASGAIYVAPANGWYCGVCREGGIRLSNQSANNFGVHSPQTAWSGGKAYIPCQKGDKIAFEYAGTTKELTFYYAEGDTPAESEV